MCIKIIYNIFSFGGNNMKKEKTKRNISLDPEINEVCRELKINVSKECNNFLKILVNIEDSDEGGTRA